MLFRSNDFSSDFWLKGIPSKWSNGVHLFAGFSGTRTALKLITNMFQIISGYLWLFMIGWRSWSKWFRSCHFNFKHVRKKVDDFFVRKDLFAWYSAIISWKHVLSCRKVFVSNIYFIKNKFSGKLCQENTIWQIFFFSIFMHCVWNINAKAHLS